MHRRPAIKEWNALTPDQKLHLEDFILANDMSHVKELEALGFVRWDKDNTCWIATSKGMLCFAEGMNGSYR